MNLLRTTLLPLHGRLAVIALFSVMALSAFIPASAFASSSPTACASHDTHCFITQGDQLIAARLKSLDALADKVTQRLNNKLITVDQANALRADVSTNKSGLAALRTKLNAESNVSAARTDDKNIFLQFRIYAVVLPRDYRSLYLDTARNVDARLRGLSGHLKQAIQGAPPSKQKQLQTLYNGYIAQLATAEAQFDLAQRDLPKLTPANFNYSHASYESSLNSLTTALKTIHTALHRAGIDAHQIAQTLKRAK